MRLWTQLLIVGCLLVAVALASANLVEIKPLEAKVENQIIELNKLIGMDLPKTRDTISAHKKECE